ncbi:unnamed protein product [Gordionus sp. m RMFG-2023]
MDKKKLDKPINIKKSEDTDKIIKTTDIKHISTIKETSPVKPDHSTIISPSEVSESLESPDSYQSKSSQLPYLIEDYDTNLNQYNQYMVANEGRKNEIIDDQKIKFLPQKDYYNDVENYYPINNTRTNVPLAPVWYKHALS